MDIRTKQEKELLKLIRRASETQFGQKYNFDQINRYKQFRQTVPISSYSEISNRIDQLKGGAEDLFWPGSVNKFALSAGTTGSGKHLPLTNNRINADQQFMRHVVGSYLKQRPNIFSLWGKHLSLPGSIKDRDGIKVGEISAYTAQETPWWLSNFQLLNLNEMVDLPFGMKVNRAVQQSLHADLRVISAAPSWILTIFQQVLEETAAKCIRQIWPHLQLLVCGGLKLDHYRNQLQHLIGDSNIDFIETYGASEGYFAFTDDLQRTDMKLVSDNGIFYELVPHSLPNNTSPSAKEAVPLWRATTDTPYSVLVTTNAGLWRYPLNDILRFTQTEPPRIEVIGRVSNMLDDYGEAVHDYELSRALQQSSDDLGIQVGTFTISSPPVDAHSIPNHHWFIQLEQNISPNTLTMLGKHIDEKLQSINRHYAIRRESNALDQPTVRQISQEQINCWLKANNKHRAQGKLPAILQDKEDINFFL